LNPFLRTLIKKKVQLSSLVIAVAQVLNVSVVRRLRRLRGTTVHFAFIPDIETTGLEEPCSEKQGGVDSSQQTGRMRFEKHTVWGRINKKYEPTPLKGHP
jgi:hypothetical protein